MAKGTKAIRHQGTQGRGAVRAFTITEILIVIGIMVLMMAMAVPALNLMTGSRSVEAAQNQVSAMLSRARGEAIYLNQNVGVAFFLDRVTDRTTMAMVRGDPVSRWIDFLSGREFQPLQAGIGAQVLSGYQMDAGGNATSDRYLRVGVIMFDRVGKLVSVQWAVQAQSNFGQKLGLPATVSLDPASWTVSGIALYSQFGLVVYDRAKFQSQPGATEGDYDFYNSAYPSGVMPNLPYTATTYDANEVNEENWLDQNGLLLIVNRYNGTLFKSE